MHFTSNSFASKKLTSRIAESPFKSKVILSLGPRQVKKIYFYDNGVRNTVPSNFNPISMRDDKGALWENYLVSERLKRNLYTKHYCNTYFWRTFDQAEVDYIEEHGGALNTFEFKRKTNRKRVPASLLKAYKVDSSSFIDKESYTEFLTY